jgi:hypothetical protein
MPRHDGWVLDALDALDTLLVDRYGVGHFSQPPRPDGQAKCMCHQDEKVVDARRGNGATRGGSYHCEIATNSHIYIHISLAYIGY